MRRTFLSCAILVSGMAWATNLAAAPASGAAILQAAAADLAIVEAAQFFHHGRPYCWYPYGWAGPGWYWCGYGTRDGLGWGGGHGWNNWVVPRPYRAYRPAYRFRRAY